MVLFSRAPWFADSLDAKVLLSSGIITAYTWATAYEFWRGRSEPLVSRWPAIFMLFAHGSLFLLRTPLSQVLPWSPNSQVFDSVWLTVLSFEALLFTIAIAFILLAMAKERTELRHKTAALIDPLTGIANRRAFLEDVDGAEPAAEARRRGRSWCCSPTSITSSRSTTASVTPSATGCCGVRETASGQAGPSDLIGRLGGEEFAILLHDAGREKGHAIAERMRLAFEERSRNRGHPVGGTVSIGMVVAEPGFIDIPALLGAGRRGALLRQRARPQPRRDRFAACRAGAGAQHRAAGPCGPAGCGLTCRAAAPGISHQPCCAPCQGQSAVSPPAFAMKWHDRKYRIGKMHGLRHLRRRVPGRRHSYGAAAGGR